MKFKKKTSLHGRRLNHINTNISTDIFQSLSVQSTRVHKTKKSNNKKKTKKTQQYNIHESTYKSTKKNHKYCFVN